MAIDEKPLANPFVMLREEFDDWAILFNPDTGHGFGLSPTGVYVWKLLDGEHSIDGILKALRRDAEVVPPDAGDHINEFVEELAQHGLVTHDAEMGPPEGRRGKSPPAPRASRRATDATKFAYKPPKLINLSAEQATGQTTCNSHGSYATSGNCYMNGRVASAAECASHGLSAGSQCYSGTTPGTAYGYTLGCSWCTTGCTVVDGTCTPGTTVACSCPCGSSP